MNEKRWLFGLTADEWLHLASEGENSEVGPCCANLSDLREILNALATAQEPDGIWARLLSKQLLEHYEIVNNSHDHDLLNSVTFPTLHRVLQGARCLTCEHEWEDTGFADVEVCIDCDATRSGGKVFSSDGNVV